MDKVIDRNNFDEVLEKYRGANAQVWLFHISHKRLAIRLSRHNEKKDLYIIGITCDYIRGPFSWKNAEIKIYKEENKEILEPVTRVVDLNADFEFITSGLVNLVTVDSLDLKYSFDDFFLEGRE
ncbi:hypothetical protein GO495_31480 [Chitinophaga oryziterrae]|uniref:Uncharacterized protein n=1 Tax=Chitinophaga oryziterrae TaxID=1031224 RepID=A0A6N8JLV1_9BACT|nr:hypothetical protein [Chitinophaga oryziterrae]MVT45152.1 hypothetical protein [Chitinophaga oryziterrae]